MSESELSTKRNEDLDIIKGIGILSVVIGHAFNTDVFSNPLSEGIRRFVYIYHLAIFFICAGFFYRKHSIKRFIKNIFLNQYLKTTIICLLSFLLLPLWKWLGVIDASYYTKHTIIGNIYSCIKYLPCGVLTGALWFMPFYSIALIIFAILCAIFKENHKIIIPISFFIGFCGLYFLYRGITNTYYIFDSMIMQPILCIGKLAKDKNISFTKKWESYAFIPIGLLILLLNYLSGLEIELSHGKVYGIVGFYPMTILGICFCISLCIHIKGKKSGRFFAFIGKRSFYIMSFHFMAFKLLDAIIGIVKGESVEILSLFPISHSSVICRLLYILVGLGLPLLISFLIENIKVVGFMKKTEHYDIT